MKGGINDLVNSVSPGGGYLLYNLNCREKLGIDADNDAYFSFCTIARRDPDPGGNCPDCKMYRKTQLRIAA